LFPLDPESRILDPVAAAAVNHLLRGAGWAREELKRHAGKTARFEVAPLDSALTVLESGEVAPAAAGTVPAVTLKLTPSFPAHSPYTLPVSIGPILLLGTDFWQEFDVHLVQRGDIEPRARSGQPLQSCDVNGTCWLVGAVVTYEFDVDQVASRPATVVVLSPDGQQLEAEFELDRLR